MAISLGGGGSASQVNETIDINSAENLITLEDGRVYLKGGVTETDLTTYPDATSNFAYSGTSFSVAGQRTAPTGIAWDGTHFWVIGPTSPQRVYKYNAAGVYQNVLFDVTAQGTDPMDIVWDGTYFWVINNAGGNKRVNKYSAAGVYQNVFWDYTTVTAMEGQGLAWDGTYFWVVGNSTDTIRKFNAAGVDQGVSYSVAAQETSPRGITFDGTYLWVVGTNSAVGATQSWAYKYNTSGVYQNESFNVEAQDTSPQGIVSIGDNFWTVGTTTDAAYKYEKQIGVTDNASASQIANGKQNYVRIK
jgi:hypothetical protein